MSMLAAAFLAAVALPVAAPFEEASLEANALSLLIAVPLTKNNVPVPDPGWIQLASALMAVDHFNHRDPSVLSDLPSLLQGCSDVKIANVSVLDTGTNEHLAIEDLLRIKQSPHAIVGPYNEIPALELSVLATTLQIPIVAHRADDSNLLAPEKHPYFSQVNPDPLSEMAFLGTYLSHTGRDDFIAVLYSTSASTMQKVDLLRVILLDQHEMNQVRTFSYHNTNDGISKALPDASIQSALEKVKATGFRTIVWITDDIRQEAPLVHEVASALELDRGHHFWILPGGNKQQNSQEQFEFMEHALRQFQPTNFFGGSAFLTSYDGIGMATRNAFENATLALNQSFVERLEELTPISNYYNWSYAANNKNETWATILQHLQSWWLGSGYIYDATMAVGIGACQALRNKNTASYNTTTPTVLNGKNHLKGIRSVDFQGATGRIAFKGGSRLEGTEPMAVVNLLPPGRANETYPIWMTETRDPKTGEFVSYQPFVYADGNHIPPLPLRDTPPQNYLTQPVRKCGMVLMGFALLLVAISVVWIYWHRHHTVVISSPPIYLYALCFGAAIVALDIWVISHDEGQGWDSDALSTACVTSFWLQVAGVLIIYNSMFTKHWRVDLLIRRKSHHIEMWRMAWPSALFSGFIVANMAHCMVSTDYGWYRVVVDEVSGASVGSCDTSDGYVPWSYYLLHVTLMLPIFHAARVAYKTLEIDELYSESKWVLVFILLQFQVFLVGGPMIHILDGVSPDGKFVGVTMLDWTIATSTIGLMIFPKMWTVRKMHCKAAEAENEQGESRLTEEAQVQSSNEAPSLPRRNSMSSSLRASTASLRTPNSPRVQVVTFD